MQLVRQWNAIDRDLPAGWGEAHLSLRLAESDLTGRASAILGALGPGVADGTIRFAVRSRGGAPSPGLVSKLLSQLDGGGIGGELTLVEATAPEADAAPEIGFALAWEQAQAALPDDWSDLYAELEFRSTDHLAPVALAIAPLNPSRLGHAPILRFRAARVFGYGASTSMVKRCLERLDEQGLSGQLRIVHVLADTHPVGTQGPVWRVGGRAV